MFYLYTVGAFCLGIYKSSRIMYIVGLFSMLNMTQFLFYVSFEVLKGLALNVTSLISNFDFNKLYNHLVFSSASIKVSLATNHSVHARLQRKVCMLQCLTALVKLVFTFSWQ